MGGFYLQKEGFETQKTIEYFKNLKVERVIPSHCTELLAIAAFYNEFKIQQVKTGQELLFNFF